MCFFTQVRSFPFVLAAAVSLIALAMAGVASGQEAASNAPVTTHLSAEKYVVTVAPDGTRSERLEPLVNIVPGEAVRYTVSYSNRGDAAVSGLVVLLPLPREMALAAAADAPADAAVTYSVDGGAHFAPLADLLVSDAEGRARPAALADVTTLRWTLAAPLPPGSGGSVGCRAVLK